MKNRTAKNGKELPFKYSIRHSQRAKKLRIVVTQEKVEVVVPLKTSKLKIQDFVQSQQDWVIQAVDKLKEKQFNVKKWAPEQYSDGAELPFRGKQTKINLKKSHVKKILVDYDGGIFNILLPNDFYVEKEEMLKAAVEHWMKQTALQDALAYVEQHAKLFDLYPGKIRIKTQKSRWGSCGVHNDINLNWLLILAPPTVMEYVVVHELCHIKERNHSVRFWQLVQLHLPDYKKQREWLKLNGTSLMQGL